MIATLGRRPMKKETQALEQILSYLDEKQDNELAEFISKNKEHFTPSRNDFYIWYAIYTKSDNILPLWAAFTNLMTDQRVALIFYAIEENLVEEAYQMYMSLSRIPIHQKRIIESRLDHVTLH